jgi:hypothetical protein
MGLLLCKKQHYILHYIVYTDMGIGGGSSKTFEEAWLPEIVVVYLGK